MNITSMARGMLDMARGAGNLTGIETSAEGDLFIKYDGHWQALSDCGTAWSFGDPIHDGHINALMNRCAQLGAEA